MKRRSLFKMVAAAIAAPVVAPVAAAAEIERQVEDATALASAPPSAGFSAHSWGLAPIKSEGAIIPYDQRW